MYYHARFNDDTRSASPTTVGRRNLYPGPTEYRDIPLLPALDEKGRSAAIRQHVETREQLTTVERLALLKKLNGAAKEYSALARVVDANARRREQESSLPPEHWSRVLPLDPRRWCEDCAGRRVHRHGCQLIEFDGPYIGGYPDDGTRTKYPQRFVKLATPGKHWQPTHHRAHARAVHRRWRAFSNVWTSIGIDYLTRVLEAGAKEPRPPRDTTLPKKRPRKKKVIAFALPVTPMSPVDP